MMLPYVYDIGVATARLEAFANSKSSGDLTRMIVESAVPRNTVPITAAFAYWRVISALAAPINDTRTTDALAIVLPVAVSATCEPITLIVSAILLLLGQGL
jgi:hypothetical protein